MSTGVPIVHIRGVSKTFLLRGPWPWSPSRQVEAVRQVDLQVGADEVLAVVGQSGSGKTTLSRMVLGLESPSEGEILLEGRRWDNLPEAERHRLRVQYQYVPQDAMSALDPQQTALEHVEETLRVLGGRSHADAHSDALRMLEHLGLAERCDALPREMSGGEQRRVTLARVLALHPRLVVADEPTSGLDPDRREEVLRDLVGNLPAGSACMLVTHDMETTRDWATRAVVMLDGWVIEIFDPREQEPLHPYGRALYAPWSVPMPRGVLGAHGCPYHLDCPLAVGPIQEECRERMPALRPVGETGRRLACHAFDADGALNGATPAPEDEG